MGYVNYVKCSICGKMVNDRAQNCPFCSAAVSQAPAQEEDREKEVTAATSGRTGHCDICNTSIIVAQAHIVKTDLIRRATAKGYIPSFMKALAIPELGLTPSVMWNNTIQAGASTDWALCDSCHRDVVEHAEKSGCFIATAACRTPEAWEVVTLSRFRDEALNESAPGRAFVRWYYRVSPRLAALIARRAAWRAVVRNLFVRPSAGVAWLWLKITVGLRRGSVPVIEACNGFDGESQDTNRG